MARIAASLATLRGQIDALYPKRDKTSDGWIGDPAHAARKSDHNPNASGVVQALDITHDLDKKGDDFDSWKFAEALRQNRDRRIEYVISNGRIFYTYGKMPWQWQKYTGSNSHALHVHISVVDDKAIYDDASRWVLEPSGPLAPKPPPVQIRGITEDMRMRMAKQIFEYEVRRNKKGEPTIYIASDGSYEFAGINVTNHPQEANKLRDLIAAGKYADAETAACDYILAYTKQASGWTTDAGVEFYLRDCVFNRGPKGAARILQRALGVKDDGEVGPTTRGAMEYVNALDLLTKLRAARESYEIAVFGRRAQLWTGLVNRWGSALIVARAFHAEGQQPTIKVVTGVIVAAGTSGTAVAAAYGVDWFVVGAIILGTALLAAVVFSVLRNRKK